MPSPCSSTPSARPRALVLTLLFGVAALTGSAQAQPGAVAAPDPRAPYDPFAQPAGAGAEAAPATGDEIPAPRRPWRAAPAPAAPAATPEADGAEASERTPVEAPAAAPSAPALVAAEAASLRAPDPPGDEAAPALVLAKAETAPQEQRGAAFSRRVMESASAYLRYLKATGAMSGSYADGAAVAKDVRIGAAYEPAQFQEGAIAAAAVVALQDRAFVEGVHSAYAGDPARADALAAQILANPAAVLNIEGSDTAAARASAALRRQGDRLLAVGARVKRASYEVQRQAWSKGDIAAPEARLAGAKSLSAARAAPPREETERLLKRVLAEEGAQPLLAERSASPVVVRALALAALAAMDEAGGPGGERVLPLLAEERQGECLKMAKLNLFQCLAVAGPHYEDLFCLGQHALMDTAQCVIAASGVGHALLTAEAAAPTPRISAPPEDFWVPVAAPAESAGAAPAAVAPASSGGARR